MTFRSHSTDDGRLHHDPHSTYPHVERSGEPQDDAGNDHEGNEDKSEKNDGGHEDNHDEDGHDDEYDDGVQKEEKASRKPDRYELEHRKKHAQHNRRRVIGSSCNFLLGKNFHSKIFLPELVYFS